MPTPKTVKVYVAEIWHMQNTLGLTEPIEYSLMPKLQLMLSGIQPSHSQKR